SDDLRESEFLRRVDSRGEVAERGLALPDERRDRAEHAEGCRQPERVALLTKELDRSRYLGEWPLEVGVVVREQAAEERSRPGLAITRAGLGEDPDSFLDRVASG